MSRRTNAPPVAGELEATEEHDKARQPRAQYRRKDPDRVATGRIGALTLHARYGPGAKSGPGRTAATSKLNEQLIEDIRRYDPDVTDDQLAERLKYARSAHFSKLARRRRRRRMQS